MRLTIQKKLAGQLLKCSPARIWINPDELEDVSQAITKEDIKSLMSQGIIKKKQQQQQSRVRARKRALQKKKGRQSGHGHRKGKKTARLPKKTAWINKIRPQKQSNTEGIVKEEQIIKNVLPSSSQEWRGL